MNILTVDGKVVLADGKVITPPTPSGTINITENGTVDVADYGTAVVNVAGGASIPEIIVTSTITNGEEVRNWVLSQLPQGATKYIIARKDISGTFADNTLFAAVCTNINSSFAGQRDGWGIRLKNSNSTAAYGLGANYDFLASVGDVFYLITA